jgi:lipopolysaccharide export system protein LptA
MKRMKQTVAAGLLLLGVLFSGSTFAAKDSPVQLSAEVIEYHANEKFVQAKGNVIITQDKITLRGPYGEYRSETRTAMVNGGIFMSTETMSLTGQRVDYNTDSGVGLVTGEPRMENKDGAWVTGDKIDFYVKEDRAVVVGNVHVVHPGRQIDAVADYATYYGKERKVVLTGHTRAIQEGNTLVGDTLTIYMDDKTMDAQGNTKLVIIPDEKK